jgi:hypothetical protein
MLMRIDPWVGSKSGGNEKPSGSNNRRISASV